MRYLDREPRNGDRIWFAVEAVYVRRDDDGSHRVDLGDVFLSVSSGDIAGVIAPKPAVGDVVTEDMDLPPCSIIEEVSTHVDETSSVTAKLGPNGLWWNGRAWIDLRDLLKAAGPWHIARIGGTP